jgi:hypothetical protein
MNKQMINFFQSIGSWFIGNPTNIPSISGPVARKKPEPLILPKWKRDQRKPAYNCRMFYCAAHHLDKNGKPTPYRRPAVKV